MLLPEENAQHEELVKSALEKLRDMAEKEDSSVRFDLIREAKRNDLFWHGFQHIFWDAASMDWRVPTHEDLRNVPFVNEQTEVIYDYVINIIKPHGESIIAALSAQVPSVRFRPFDPEASTDIGAAKEANNAAEKVLEDNTAKLLFIHALFTFYTEHILGGFTYSKKDESLPKVAMPVMGNVDKTQIDSECPNCPFTEQEMLSPDEVSHSNCPDCNSELLSTEQPISIVEQTGTSLHPRSRQIMELYGILNLKVPLYVKKQDDFGYLINFVDVHYSDARATYPDIKEEIKVSSSSEEKFVRAPSIGSSTTTSEYNNLVTIKRCWFRPSYYNALDDPDEITVLEQLFPKGVRADFVEDKLGRVKEDSMDDHWRVTKPGLSRFSHADPICNSLISPQELRNNGINYLTQSLEYSVPETFADPRVLDFNAYRNSENSPGLKYPATTQNVGERPLGEFFHSERAATFPKDGVDFIALIDQDSQFLSGDYPSVRGGPGEGGSRTLGEYTQSRAYALQRLSIPWIFLNLFWADFTHIAVKDYMRNLLTDDFFSRQSKTGYDKVWIRKAFSEGDFDVIYPESSDTFPVSAAQRLSILTELIKLNSEEINAVLFSSLNAREVADTLGLDRIKFPNEAQVNKQYREIEMMLEQPAMDLGDGNFESTVQIEPEVDIDEIHLEITGNFLSGDTGQDLKMSNPEIYMNILAHHRQHFISLQQKQLQQQLSQTEEEVEPK